MTIRSLRPRFEKCPRSDGIRPNPHRRPQPVTDLAVAAKGRNGARRRRVGSGLQTKEWDVSTDRGDWAAKVRKVSGASEGVRKRSERAPPKACTWTRRQMQAHQFALYASPVAHALHGRVRRADHLRLDGRQQLRGRPRIHAQRLGEVERGAHVPAEHRARDRADLTAEPPGQVPDLPALIGERPVQDFGAVRAPPRARGAVAVAPAVAPFGEGAEAFSSASSRSALATTFAWNASKAGQRSRRA